MPEKIQERSNKTINTTSSIIPTQYENMLSELVEETLKYKALPADNEKIKSILEDLTQTHNNQTYFLCISSNFLRLLKIWHKNSKLYVNQPAPYLSLQPESYR